jgi:hypothetical protein
MRVKFCSFEFDIRASLKAVLLHLKDIKTEQAENKNAEECTHQISFKINEKSWRNFKLFGQVIT